jgi:hypothetical protein
VPNPYFFAGHESELRDLVNSPADLTLDQAACAGVDPELYHPEGQPDELSLFRCSACPARLACLALALRAEDAEVRSGWYGGISPTDRDDIAQILRLEPSQPVVPDRAVEAARLQASGWTINQIATQIGCSRRTVQRYLRIAA